MRSELRAAAALTAAVLLALAGAGSEAAGQDVSCGDPIEPGQVACPDLALARSATRPVEEDGQFVLTVVVRNLGNASSPATAVAVSSPGWEPGRGEVPELPAPEAGGTVEREVTVRLPIPEESRGGVSGFAFFVDPDQRIAEHDEENNALVDRAPIPEGDRPVPDLRLADAEHELVGDQRVSVSATVTNAGEAESPATTFVVSGPGWEEASTDVPSLGPGGEEPVTVELLIPDSARGTTATLTLTATPVEGEADTENNTATREVAVPEVVRLTPDLALTLTGHRFVGDATLELAATVANIGSGPAPATSLAAAAQGWPEEEVAVPALAAGEERALTLTFDVPDAARGGEASFLVAVAPVEGEAGTADNTRTRSVAVPAAPVVTAEEDGGRDWLLPAVLVGLALAGLAGLAAWRLATPRRAPPGRAPAPQPQPTRPPEPDWTGVGAEPPPAPSMPAPSSATPIPPPAAPPPAPQPEEARTELAPPAPARVVNTGFAAPAAPAQPLDPGVALAAGATYLFWLDVGPPVPRSAERTPVDLPWHRLPPSPELTVAIYALADGADAGFELDPHADLGALVVGSGGAVEVRSQPGPGDDPIARTRLLFPLRAPAAEGIAQLRCSIFCQGTLVQSRLVTARVRREPATAGGPGFESVLDFTLAPTLDPQHLAELPEPTLTVLLNRSAASHDFTFYGVGGFKSQSSFDVLEVQDLIAQARGGLRRAAWGDEDEWNEERDYLYLHPGDRERLRRDLVELAKRGFRFYASIADRLAGSGDAFELSDRLAAPGSIQIASVESPRHVLPAALLYDYLGFDSTQPAETYTLCPRFLRALDAQEDLETIACFTGDCESRGSATAVCPSGFWGYRHRLGMPVSVVDAPDSPVAIAYGEQGPSIVLAASTDFELLAAHTEAVTRLCPTLVTADTRDETLRLMRQAGVHVLYFYCHGGVQDRVPFLKVGGPGERGITGDLLFSERIRWTAPRPLVFINGCETTALEPETAIELVGSLVRRAHASGVIGTEITVFEPLARDFAEAYFERFLTGATVGAAVRGARLALLARGNPLGLVYIPFTLESLRLVAEPA